MGRHRKEQLNIAMLGQKRVPSREGTRFWPSMAIFSCSFLCLPMGNGSFTCR